LIKKKGKDYKGVIDKWQKIILNYKKIYKKYFLCYNKNIIGGKYEE